MWYVDILDPHLGRDVRKPWRDGCLAILLRLLVWKKETVISKDCMHGCTRAGI